MEVLKTDLYSVLATYYKSNHSRGELKRVVSRFLFYPDHPSNNIMGQWLQTYYHQLFNYICSKKSITLELQNFKADIFVERLRNWVFYRGRPTHGSIHQGMMHHSVFKTGSVDGPLLRLMDDETGETSRPPCPAYQFFPKEFQTSLPSGSKFPDISSGPLAPSCFQKSLPEPSRFRHVLQSYPVAVHASQSP